MTKKLISVTKRKFRSAISRRAVEKRSVLISFAVLPNFLRCMSSLYNLMIFGTAGATCAYFTNKITYARPISAGVVLWRLTECGR